MLLQPYLFFEGRCEEAAQFYEKAVGAKVGRLIRFKDSPDPSLCGSTDTSKVMHMTLQIGDQTIMASDGQCQGSQKYEGFALSLTVKNEAEADRRFNALAEGGQVSTLTLERHSSLSAIAPCFEPRPCFRPAT